MNIMMIQVLRAMVGRGLQKVEYTGNEKSVDRLLAKLISGKKMIEWSMSPRFI